MSGNGRHCLVITVDYYPDKSRDGSDGEFALLLRWFNRKYGDKSKAEIDEGNFDLARVCKCYGTAATKGGNTVERPMRTATLAIPEELPPPVDILAIYCNEIREQREYEAKESGYKKSKKSGPESRGDLQTLDIVSLFKSRDMYLGPSGKDAMHKVRCPWSPEHTSGMGLGLPTLCFLAMRSEPT